MAVLAFHVVQHAALGNVMTHHLTECAANVGISVVAVALASVHGLLVCFSSVEGWVTVGYSIRCKRVMRVSVCVVLCRGLSKHTKTEKYINLPRKALENIQKYTKKYIKKFIKKL